MRFNPREYKPECAYFSMGGYLEGRMPTYSGGLEVLAGDMIRACADLRVPVVGVMQSSSDGFFRQEIDKDGKQIEEPVHWSPRDSLERMDETVTIRHKDRDLKVGAEIYVVRGITGFEVPVYLLDTDFEENHPEDRKITGILYDADDPHRIAQENVLGQGGVKFLRAMGYDSIRNFAMNEGHAAFGALECLASNGYDVETTKAMCTFTTHTPIDAAHEEWDYELVRQIVGDFIPENITELAGEEKLSMTRLLLNLSRYTNGVSKKHSMVCRTMPVFEGREIDYITNGIHPRTWVNGSIAKLYDDHFPYCWLQPRVFEGILDHIPIQESLEAKATMKRALTLYVNERNPVKFRSDSLTLVWARRFTGYKRPLLLFRDIDKLEQLAEKYGPLEIIISGKSHPRDGIGKQLIQDVYRTCQQFSNNIKAIFLKDYDTKLARRVLGGADVWLNTPRRPLEASGTSGMKAALNGTINLTVNDGWVSEGYKLDPEGMFIIGPKDDNQVTPNPNKEEDDAIDADSLYEELEEIMKIYYSKRVGDNINYLKNEEWGRIMAHSIRLISEFNAHRMVREYLPKWGVELR
jgi:starch phosphorylase